MIFLIIAIAIIAFILWYQHNPFTRMPIRTFEIDISRKRNVDYKALLKTSAIQGDWLDEAKYFKVHYVEPWRYACEKIIEDSPFKSKRQEQYDALFSPTFIRVVFVRHYASTKDKIERSFTFDENSLARFVGNADKQEREMFDGMTKEEFTRKQRNLMTAKLRQQIKERDHYTCQCCGIDLSNGRGCHIDHIKPVAKGGKTEWSNLQLLCDQCNLRKSDKY